MEKAKRDLERLKAKLGSAEALSWEAKRILQLYAQGLSDWQQGEYKKPWRVNYREALETYGDEFRCPEGPSTRTVYLMMFIIQFRGGRDSEKASRSLAEFWLLARRVAPEATRKLIVKDEKDEEGREFIKSLDEVLALISAEEEEAEKPEKEVRIARRVRNLFEKQPLEDGDLAVRRRKRRSRALEIPSESEEIAMKFGLSRR